MYRLSPRGFVGPTGAEEPFLLLQEDASSTEWNAKQRRAIDQYHAPPPDEIKVFYSLFDAYIAAATYGRTSLKILDVGCGIGTVPPEYVNTLVHAGADRIYAGIDPIAQDVACRSYPFICGRIESLPSVLADRFDVFLFSTSLDHFEDIEMVARTVKQLASENAICVFWLGLHDTPAVAEQAASGFFRKLYSSLNVRHFVFEYVAALLKLLRYYWAMRRRRQRLKAGEPLDELHFHYFTADTVGKYLRLFGRLTNQLRIPGSNMLFATVSPGDSR